MATSTSSDSIINTLPEEIWINILAYLRPIDILRVRLVCKQLAFLSTVPRIKKKLRLRLVNQKTTKQLREYMTQNEVNFLPVYSLNVIDQEDHEDLAFILKSFATNLRCLRLKNSIVFKSVASAQLDNIQDLNLNFYETSPERLNEADLQFIKRYKNMSTLNIICPDELIFFCTSILEELLESETIFPLERLHLTYHFDMNDKFMDILQKFGSTLIELEIYFDSQPYPWSPSSWFEVLSQLENLEILRISGDCRANMTTAFFQSLPKSAPLRLIELDGITTLTDDILIMMTDKWIDTIASLSIFFSGRITQKGAAEIWKLRKSLESLKIGYCRTVGMKEVLSAVASDTNNTLRQLCTYSMGNVNEDYLCSLAKNLPKLEVLDFSDNTQGLTNCVLAHIFRYQTNLRELYLDGCFGFNDVGIAGLGMPDWSVAYPITRLRNLEVLSLQSCRNLKEDFIDYLIFSNLRTLKLNKLRHLNALAFRKIIKNCPSLEVLHVACCRGLNDETLHFICDNLKLLIELNIENCSGISEKAIDYAKRTDHIRYLTFSKKEIQCI